MSLYNEDDYTNMMLQQADKNNAFNAEQAEINRDWEEYMSNTSHQREVMDLQAAGINPVLSANSGASWSGVSNATADTNSTVGLANLATTYMNNQTALETAQISAAAVMAAAATTAAATSYAAETAAAASKYASDSSYASSALSSATSAYGHSVGSITGLLSGLFSKSGQGTYADYLSAAMAATKK